jgi:putative SOS response-associated peptidase YedK
MCYHKSLTKAIDYLADYYSATYDKVLEEMYSPHYHENGFDFLPTPILTAGKPKELQMMNWGLVPWWTKTENDALRIRVQTLNCISEEMFEKSAFKDVAREGRRCLIPCTGFFEWRWMDEKGKMKVPYFIKLKDQEMFSIAGLYSKWKDRENGRDYYSYTVLTTRANRLMEKIHNSKKRMPVILPREYEKDWLNPNLGREDVLALCQPSNDSRMDSYTISKLITNKKEETDVPKVLEPETYAEVKD